jgi:glycerol-3-phosphate acyltransferase PlsY
MNSWLSLSLACLLAYLLGSVSFAVIGSRLFGLADPRSYGSGNPGATNVLRTGNKKAALFTLLGDAGKGAAAVLAARACALPELHVELAALCVFLGHLYPLFLKFRGGKGVATAAGALLALAPWVGLATLATWIATAWVSRYSSLAALLAALSAPFWVLLCMDDGPLLVITLLALFLIARHRSNIGRLFAGQEEKIGKKKKP